MVSGHNKLRAIHHVISFLSAIPDDPVEVFIVSSGFSDPCGLHSPLIFQRFLFMMLIMPEMPVKIYS